MKYLEVRDALETAHDRQMADLEAMKCGTCGGSGECDDMDIGDIRFNKWTCKACNGSGFSRQRT